MALRHREKDTGTDQGDGSASNSAEKKDRHMDPEPGYGYMGIIYFCACVFMCVHAVPNAEGDSAPLHDLFEQWINSGEEWRKSQLYVRIQNQVGQIDSDARGWVSKAELTSKLGSAGADSMIAFLEATAPEKCRDHPDAPGVQDTSTI